MEKVCPKCRRAYGGADMFCPEDGAALVLADGAAAATVIDGSPRVADDPLIGRVIDGRYELTELLGSGGMGRVYLAQHRFLKRLVAVKILHRGRVDDPSELVRFNRTAVHAGTITSDHVAGVYDFGETEDGLLYLAMEYVPGDTVARMVKAEGPFALARVAELARQIASGLDAAHAQGIIHRDLKPDNVMIMRDRHGRDMVKIVDFGIAKALGSETRNVTQHGAVVGTLLYMSPEQLSAGELDRRSDVYSFGLVLFYMLTGALPFAGSRPEEVIYARFDPAGPRHLATVRPSVAWPPGLQTVIDRALARDSAARFDTAGSLAEAFGRAVAAPVADASPAAPPHVQRERSAGGAVRQPERRPRGARRVGDRLTALRDSLAGLMARHGRLAAGALFVVALGVIASKYLPTTRAADDPVTGRPMNVAGGTVPVTRTDTSTAKPRETVEPNDTAGTTDPPPRREPVRSRGSKETSRGVPNPPTSDATHRAALKELERYRWQLHPDSAVSPDAARAAIGRLEALLPRLTTRNDSLFALLYESHAYFHLQDLDRQCAVLRRIRPRAAGTRLEPVIDEYFGYGKCA